MAEKYKDYTIYEKTKGNSNFSDSCLGNENRRIEVLKKNESWLLEIEKNGDLKLVRKDKNKIEKLDPQISEELKKVVKNSNTYKKLTGK